MIRSGWLIAVVTVLCGAASVLEAGGGLKGTFIYNGKTPAAVPEKVTTDVAFCGKHGLVQEQVAVGKDGGLANVAVFLYLKRGDTVKIDPACNALKGQVVHLDNAMCRFAPRMVGVWTEQKLVVGNKDTVAHNTKVDCLVNKPQNPLLPPAGELEIKFTEAERLPVAVSCNIHPWMKGWVIVRDNPYFAVSGADGNFEIKHLPVGKWEFQVWHETAGYVKEVTMGGKATPLDKGRLAVTIAEGKVTDLGKLLVDPKLFTAAN